MSTPTILEKQILATIIYYDILNYPLTSLEVFLYLVNNNKNKNTNDVGTRHCLIDVGTRHCLVPTEVIELLNTSEYLKKYLDQKLGFYFLNVGTRQCLVPTDIKTDIVQQRLDRKKLADWKWKKIKKIFWIMQVVPFVKMVLVSGSLALGNSKKESDVDLIITAEKGRIWTVRTFVTLLTSILGTRRYKNKTENKICLNHYITNESLKIPFESLYNAQSYLHLINVYDSEKDKKIFKKFQQENSWIKKYVLNYEYSELGSFRSIKRNRTLNFISVFLETIFSGKRGDYLEKKLAVVQSKRIKKDKLYKKSGGRITINNSQLEFHPASHEADIIPEFNKRMEQIGLLEFGGQKDSGLTNS